MAHKTLEPPSCGLLGFNSHVDHVKLRYEDYVNSKPQTTTVPPPLPKPVPSNESSEKGGEEQQIVAVVHSIEPIEPVIEPLKTLETPKVQHKYVN